MAAELTVNSVDEDGIDPAYVAVIAGTGNYFDNDENTLVHIVNGSGAPTNAVIQAQGASKFEPGYGDILLPNITIAVPAGEDRAFMCPPARFNDGNGQCTIICSAETTVRIAAMKLVQV